MTGIYLLSLTRQITNNNLNVSDGAICFSASQNLAPRLAPYLISHRAIALEIDTSISAFIAQAAHWDNDHLTLHLRRDAVLQLSKSAQIHLFRQLIGIMGHAQYRPSFDAVSRLLTRLCLNKI